MATHCSTDTRDPPLDRNSTLRVMLVDDSIVVRSIIERIIETAGGFAVVASVPKAQDALAVLEQDVVDLIVLDLEMPGIHGLAAIPMMLQRSPQARIIILSANCEDGGPAAVEALALGAADTLLKPGRGSFAGKFGETLVDRLRNLAAASNEQPLPARSRLNTAEHGAPSLPPRQLAAIGIGASTGGILAINTFISALPGHIDLPLLITQHLPAGFMGYFAEQLQRVTQRKVQIAEDGMPIQDGHIYVAPGAAHLRVTRMASGVRVMLDSAPAPSGASPSVDPMMASLADCFGSAACGVMLTGMGRDGLEGVRRIRQVGGLIMAQNLASSVVWGMPGAVARDGLADAVADPESLALQIGQLHQSARP